MKHSVERKIFDALVTTGLLGKDETVKDRDYSRCGRTDSGVSAAGNVISLRLSLSEAEKATLVKRLNSALPPDIAVLAWAEVGEDFSARYNCKGREYRYYFGAEGLDVQKMNEAAASFVGTHNFKNFCKWNARYALSGTTQTITACEVLSDSRLAYERLESNATQLVYLRCEGRAFLWHQIRLIMNVLKVIGRGEQPVSLVAEMLEDFDSKKFSFSNGMCPGEQLVLYDCKFEGIEWKLEEEQQNPTLRLMKSYQEKLLDLKVFSSIIESFEDNILGKKLSFKARRENSCFHKKIKK